MKIDYYSFGVLQVDGKRYSSDVILYTDGTVNSSWWRRSGHNLQIEDLDRTADMKPEIVIVGTGASGLMRVEKKTLDYLKSLGSRVIVEPTERAVKSYNELAQSHEVLGLFHLTC